MSVVKCKVGFTAVSVLPDEKRYRELHNLHYKNKHIFSEHIPTLYSALTMICFIYWRSQKNIPQSAQNARRSGRKRRQKTKSDTNLFLHFAPIYCNNIFYYRYLRIFSGHSPADVAENSICCWPVLRHKTCARFYLAKPNRQLTFKLFSDFYDFHNLAC